MEKSASPQQQIFPHSNRGQQQQQSFNKSLALFILSGREYTCNDLI